MGGATRRSASRIVPFNRLLLGGLAAAGLLVLALPAQAQWMDREQPGLPEKADGSFDADAPTPRMPDGKPDFSGVWSARFATGGTGEADEVETDGIPYQQWARDLTLRRIGRNFIDDPSSRCLPPGHVVLYTIPPIMKFVQQSDLIVMLYEPHTFFRQVFMDGRELETDPVPSYNGYSVARWEGDTLVVESNGYNGEIWIDSLGRPTTEKLRITERWSRPTFGRMVVELTFDDPGAYTRPWHRKHTLDYKVKGNLMELFCVNNEFDDQLKELGEQVE